MSKNNLYSQVVNKDIKNKNQIYLILKYFSFDISMYVYVYICMHVFIYVLFDIHKRNNRI